MQTNNFILTFTLQLRCRPFNLCVCVSVFRVSLHVLILFFINSLFGLFDTFIELNALKWDEQNESNYPIGKVCYFFGNVFICWA